MRRTIEESLDTRLSTLPLLEKLKLIESIRELCFEHEFSALTEEASKPHQTKIPVCKTCGSMHVSRYGKRSGKQRYKCCDCNHLFTEHTKRSLVHSSKLTRATLMRYINCFVQELPVAKCAAECGISIPTAYSLRLRILSLIKQTERPWKLTAGNKAQLDATYVLESFKGNRTGCKDFEMPREAFVRGRRSDYGKALSQGMALGSYICVATGVDEYRKCFFEISGRGTERAEDLLRVLGNKISAGAYITTDDQFSYVGVLRKLKAHHTSFVSTDSNGNLNSVNAMHSHFKAFLARKRGVSTRRLSLYLAEFSWRWTQVLSDETTQNTATRIIRKIAKTDFLTKVQDFASDPYPCFEWWNTKEGKREKIRLDLVRQQVNIAKAYKEAGDDEEELRIAEERQAALIKKAAEHNIKITGVKESIKVIKSRKAAPRMTIQLLKDSF